MGGVAGCCACAGPLWRGMYDDIPLKSLIRMCIRASMWSEDIFTGFSLLT